MNKKLQDLAWQCLPLEAKREAKQAFCLPTENDYEQGYDNALASLFGLHNLTSDAEGEELLTCEKYKVEEALNYCDELDSISGSHNMLNWGKQMIAYLFGSKCLLDEDAHEDNFVSIEPKPAEPKEEADKQFDNILKDGFSKERRLNIATQIVASMISSDDWTTWRGGSNKEIWHNMAKSSLEIADALIAEAEKGGEE